MTPEDRRYRTALIALVTVGAVLRLAGLGWDEGRGLHPDERNLVEGALTLGPGGALIPAFHAYNDLALWIPRLLSLPVCDNRDSGCLTIVARLVSALLSLATIPIAAALARRIMGRVAGVATAAAFAGSAPLIQWAHFGTTESAMILVVVALWGLCVRWQAGALDDRTMTIGSSALIALGFGFKTAALATAVIPLVTLALAGRPDVHRLRAIAVGVAVGPFGLFLVVPSLIFAPGEWLEVMRFEGHVVSGHLPVFWTAQFESTRAVLFEVRQLWFATAGAGLILAVVGAAGLSRRTRRLVAPALAFAVVYAAIIFGWHARFFRYLAPLLPVILVLAGLGIARLARLTHPRTALTAALAGLGLMTMAGVDEAAIYWHPDPRIAADTTLRNLAGPSDKIVVEPHDVAQTAGFTHVVLPLTLPETAATDLAEPLAAAQWMVIASRRNWAVLPRLRDAPEAICGMYAGLASGELGYVPFRRFTRLGPFGTLFAPDLRSEETRVVFVRPEVILLRNIGRMSAEDIATRIRTNEASCDAETLQTGWRRGP